MHLSCSILGFLIFYLIAFSKGEAHHGRFVNGRFFGPINITSIIPKDIPKDNIEIGWFIQPLDHFIQNDHRTWKQKYSRNGTYFEVGGPLCIMLGGEGPLESRWVSVGEMAVQCRELQGVSYALEHRFYGDSRPLPDMTVKSLEYLSVAQVLQDTARFITFAKSKEGNKVGKVILYGGSYAATLVAYFRQKYPSFADIAVASSAPIQWKYDFKDYMEVVGRVLKSYGEDCYNIIKSGVNHLSRIISEESANNNPINSKLSPLKLCSNLYPKNTMDVHNVFSAVAGIFSYQTQYNGIDTGNGMTIKEICSAVTTHYGSKSSSSDYNTLSSIVNLLFSKMQQDCVDFSSAGFCNYINKTSWNDHGVQDGTRAWNWQVCNEFVSFITTNSQNQPFAGVPIELFVFQCQCAFGEKYTANFIYHKLQKHMQTYGSFNARRTNVIYINGDSDPWGSIGVRSESQISTNQNHPDSICVILIKDGSHCNDLSMPKPTDSTSLQNARAKVFECIKNLS